MQDDKLIEAGKMLEILIVKGVFSREELNGLKKYAEETPVFDEEFAIVRERGNEKFLTNLK